MYAFLLVFKVAQRYFLFVSAFHKDNQKKSMRQDILTPPKISSSHFFLFFLPVPSSSHPCFFLFPFLFLVKHTSCTSFGFIPADGLYVCGQRRQQHFGSLLYSNAAKGDKKAGLSSQMHKVAKECHVYNIRTADQRK